MPRLTFRLDFKTSELRSMDLPVEVRRPNATLLKSVLTSDVVELPAGEYYATTRLPGGQRLVAPFTLEGPPQQDPLEVVLAPDPEDASAHEWEEASHFLARAAPPVAPPAPATRARPKTAGGAAGLFLGGSRSVPTAPSPPPRPPQLRLFSGNVVRRTHAAEDPAPIVLRVDGDVDRVVQIEVAAVERLLVAQLVQPGGAVQNTAIPLSGQAGARVSITRHAPGDYRLDVRLNNPAADMLLQYSSYGASGSAAVAGRSAAVDGERLLHSKGADPIAAAVGAYSILTLGDPDRLHDWSAHLCEWFSWLPDGAAIHAEYLARMGQHGEAFHAFAEVPERGLPIFSDGLFYTVERVKLYASRTWKGAPLVDAGLAKSVLDELLPFAAVMRRQRPVSTYPGLDVGRPDPVPAPIGFVSAQSFDLSEWFRG